MAEVSERGKNHGRGSERRSRRGTYNFVKGAYLEKLKPVTRLMLLRTTGVILYSRVPLR